MTNPPRVAATTRATTILVVDDDPSILLFCRKTLEMEGLTILQAIGSSEALKLFAEHPDAIHLLMTDVMLPPPGFQLSAENNPYPRVNGLELVDRALASVKDLRVLLMSTSPQQELLRSGLIRASLPFIQKPFTSDHLSDLVRQVLSGSPATSGHGNPATTKKTDVDWFG